MAVVAPMGRMADGLGGAQNLVEKEEKTMTVVIEREHSGQLRAYADRVYSAFISIERPELIGGAIFYQEISRELAEGLARLLVQNWEEAPGPFGTQLQTLEAIGPTESMCQKAHPEWPPGQNSRWYVKIVEPYCD